MANTKSATKRVRTSEIRRKRNVSKRSAMRTAIKKCILAIESGDVQASKELLHESVSRIDKAAKKRIIHSNKAARYKSQLARRVDQLSKSG
nr:30S ribosomal protein S20 [Pasteuria penetrans]